MGVRGGGSELINNTGESGGKSGGLVAGGNG